MADSAAKVGFQLHLEPDGPIEVADLTGALSAIARQFDAFSKVGGPYPPTERARLLISSVSPGSIDINFITTAAVALAPVLTDLETAVSFGKHLKELFAKVSDGDKSELARSDLGVRDCDDIVAISKPIASHGGNQTFNTFTGPVNQTIFALNANEAVLALESALTYRYLLQKPNAEKRERVSMVWKRLDKDQIKTRGITPDKGLIEDIDPRARAVHFTDDMVFLKREMMQDTENLYLYIYYVDVEISRVSGIVSAYRVVGYHGKEALDPIEYPNMIC